MAAGCPAPCCGRNHGVTAMFERVNIQGFKSIADADVELGKLNVFVGANGAGKSNVLEAIGLIGCAVSGRIGAE